MNDFVRHVLDLLEDFDGVSAKRMFGGHGLFRHDVMFGLVYDDTLYFKVDDGNREEYEIRELPPFRYEKKNKTIALSYRQAPADALDDPDMLAAWARRAWEAAMRARPGS